MNSPFRIAAITTCFHPNAHADVIVSRWYVKRPGDAAWGWSGPRSTIAGLYTHQCPPNDMSRTFCTEHGIPLYDTVADALCAGGSSLAVDGVMLIGEHGKYDLSSIGAHKYPRKELFDQIVQVFRDSGRSVPVFCDKHYSWNFEWAMEMERTARDMGFLLFGGSSIPLCPRRPEINPNEIGRLKTAVAVFYGPREAYGYHSLEFAQSILEKRAGGESGIESLRAIPADALEASLDEGARRLLNAAIEVAPTSKGNDYRSTCREGFPEGFVVKHRDGLSVLHANLSGHVEGWSIAMQRDGSDKIIATAALPGGASDHYAHFAGLSRVIEDGLMTRKLGYDRARNLLTTGATAAMMRAFAQPGEELKTPELEIAY